MFKLLFGTKLFLSEVSICLDMIEFVGLPPNFLESHYGLPGKPTILNLVQAGLFLRTTISRF